MSGIDIVALVLGLYLLSALSHAAFFFYPGRSRRRPVADGLSAERLAGIKRWTEVDSGRR